MKPKWMLINQLDLKNLSEAQTRWVVSAVAGALIADGKLHKTEQPHLDALLELVGDSTELQQLVWSILQEGKPPELQHQELDSEYRLKIYKIALEIAAADLELHAHELKYLYQLSKKLQIDSAQARKLLSATLQGVRIELLIQGKHLFSPSEREWVATVIVQLLWADGVIEPREIKYFSHIFELLEDQPEVLKRVRDNPADCDISQLGPPNFTPRLCESLARHMVELTIGKSGLEPEGLKVAEQASVQLNIPADQFRAYVQETLVILEN